VKSGWLQWARHIAKMGETVNAYRIFMEECVGRLRRCQDNIKMNLREVGCENEILMELTEDCFQE